MFSQKLRRILRKGIDVSENIFKKKDLLYELTYTVVDVLGDAYPELQNNLKQVILLITNHRLHKYFTTR